MQRFLIIVLFLIANVCTHAQSILNGGFEQWHNVAHYAFPQSWLINDDTGFPGIAVSSTTDAQSGNYAIKLTTIDTLITSYATLGRSFQDSSGSIVFKGVPFSVAVDTLHFYIKADIQPGDAAVVFVQLSAGGNLIDAQQLIITGTYSNWTLLKLGFNPQLLQPDSIFVAVTPSFPFGTPYQPKLNSWIVVDNMLLTAGAGLTQYLMPNYSFENWDTLFTEEPLYWLSDNYKLKRFDTTYLKKTTDAALGNYALQLSNVHLPFRNQNGFASNSTVSLYEGGVPFSEVPKHISAQFKYMPALNDTARIHAIFYKNSAVIGYWSKTFSDTSSAYTTFTEPLFISGVPDTMRIELSSGAQNGSVLFLDELRFLCVDPFDVSIGAISDTSARIYWADASFATAYEIEFGTEGFVQGQGNVIPNINDTTFNITGLSPVTTYSVYIRTICGNAYSNWSGPYSFTTACGTYTVPLSAGFENVPSGAIPQCWNRCSGTNGVVTVVDWEQTTEGARSLYMSVSAGDTAMFIGPHMQANINTLMASFSARKYTSQNVAVIEAGTMQNPYDCSTFTADTSFALADTFQVFEHFFNLYQGTDKYIAFRLITDGFAQAVTDAFNITLLPSCLPALNVSVNNTTDTSVVLDWDNPGSATTWQIKYGVAPMSQNQINTVLVTATTHQLNGLLQNTPYEVHIRSICSPGDSSVWVGPVLFNTLCGFHTIPFANNFDNNLPYTLPDCWQTIPSPNTTVEIVDWNMAQSGTNSVRMATQSQSDTAFLISPLIASQLPLLSLAFNARHGGFGQNTGIIIGTCNVSGTSSFTPRDTFWLSENYESFEIIFVNYIGNDRRIYFRTISGDAGASLFIDDVVLDFLPSCLHPYYPNWSQITDTSARVTWTEYGTASQWKIRYGLSPLQPGTGQFFIKSGSPEAVLSGLISDTLYDVFISGICSPGDTSTEQYTSVETYCTPFVLPWSENFDTPAQAQLPYCWNTVTTGNAQAIVVNWMQSVSGINSVYLYAGSVSDKSILVLPRFSAASDTLQLNFKAKKEFWTGPAAIIAGIMDAPDKPTSFIPTDTFNLGTAFSEFKAYFNLYTGNGRFPALMLSASQAVGAAYIDDIIVQYRPSCIPVRHAEPASVSETSALVTWQPGDNETLWNLVYGPFSFDPLTGGTSISGLTSSQCTINNLMPGTTYDVYIKADCGASEAEFSKITFNTLCADFAPPFSESFENAILPQLPNCWTSYTSTQAELKTVDWNQATEGTKSTYFYLNNNTNTAALILPHLNSNLNNFYIKFNAKRESWVGDALIEIAAVNPDDFSSTWEALDTIHLKTTFDSVDYYFNNYSGIHRNIGLRLLAMPGSAAAAYVDEVAVRPLPTCIPVANLNADSITETTAKIKWEQQGSENLWRIIYGNKGFDIGTGGIVNDSIINTNFLIQNLNPSTLYDVYVAARCGANDLSVYRKITFNTACLPFDVPFTEDFETIADDDVPVCWHVKKTGTSLVQTVDWGQATSGTQSLYLKKYINDTVFLTSPEIQVALDTITMGFMARKYQYSQPIKIIAGTLSNPDDLSGFVPRDTFILNDYFNPCNVFFAGVPATHNYVALKATGDALISEALVDDFEFEFIGLCNAPVNMSVDMQSWNQAHVSWTHSDNQGPFTISYGIQGFDVLTTGTQISIPSGNSSQINNLLPSTVYDFYIRSDCGQGLMSDWRGPFRFQTPLRAESTIVKNNKCYGLAEGKAYVSVLSGTPPFMYVWNSTPVQYSDTAYNLPSGTYTVSISDAAGFTGVIQVNIAEPDSLFAIPEKNNVSCNGMNNGSINLLVAGGTAPYQCLWNNGASGLTRSNLPPGTYSYTLTDFNNCQNQGAFVITQPTIMNALTTAYDNVSCRGYADGKAAVAGNGGTPPYTYIWNTNPVSNDSVVTGLSPGTYLVTITDANGCLNARSFFITQSNLMLDVNMVRTNISCPGLTDGKIQAGTTGGTQPFTYNWSNGQQTQQLQNLAAGTYYLTVTDAFNCKVIDTAVILQPQVSMTSGNISCYGAATGSIDMILGNFQGNVNIQWSGSIDSNATVTNNGTSVVVDINNIAAGTYYVQINSGQNCVVNDSVTITEPPPVTINFNSVNVSCFGDSTGSIQAQVSGIQAPLSYLWSNGKTLNNIYNLAAGTYALTITDALSCKFTDSLVLTQPDSVSLNATITDVLCKGDSTGSISIVTSGGTPPFTYIWNNNNSAAINHGLAAGSYAVTVTDNKGCKKTGLYTIIQPLQSLTISGVDVDTVVCFGDNTGNIYLSVTGGTYPYLYNWSNGQSVETASGLGRGTYHVTVTDAHQCAVFDSIWVGGPSAPITNDFEVFMPICPGGTNGTLNAHITGAAQPISYLWSNGSTDSTATGLMEGLYYITVTDGFACLFYDSIYFEPYVLNITISGPQLVYEDSFAIYSTPDPGITFLWVCSGGTITGGQGTEQVTIQWDSAGPGIVYVEITDGNNCTFSNTYNVSVIPYASVNTLENDKPLILFPNPAGAFVIADGCPYPCIRGIAVYDALGRAYQVFFTDAGNGKTKIDVAHLPPGTYFVQVGAHYYKLLKL